jgi:formylglycine-generating enzyme
VSLGVTPEAQPCCVPSTGASSSAVPAVTVSAGHISHRGQVLIPGGRFRLGDAFDEGYPADGETPVHDVQLAEFPIDLTTVTNAAFATFVKATGHVTTAEAEGFSAVFHLDYRGDGSGVLGTAAGAPWWLVVRGADWRHPEGEGSEMARRQSHPVVHVSHHDALAYAAWAGKGLPTEAQWEAAARGGLVGARFPWGDELLARGRWQCNIFQGEFPSDNEGEDGWLSTAPVKTYRSNGYGLHQMAGNVWEWCADWFAAGYYSDIEVQDPRGPDSGDARVMRGGSFLCHDSYCNRYRVAARSSSPPDSTASNLGFRCGGSIPAIT